MVQMARAIGEGCAENCCMWRNPEFISMTLKSVAEVKKSSTIGKVMVLLFFYMHEHKHIKFKTNE